ncbi:MAG TPA: ParB N-terminal domain-containing protein [Anaerolineae bacterium]|nr:ParB N-terminal domain-containing protein [Anaerolineae bacterium]
MHSLHAAREMPRLAIVPTRSLVLHEEVDPKRSEPLAGRLRAEGTLKNPPVVAPVEGEDRYVVLDGTNRLVALSVLACPHVVVQIVDYDDPDLVLDTWFHLITGMLPDEFASALQTLDGMRMEITTHLHARAELARRQAAAYAMLPGAHVSAGVHLLYVEGGAHRRAAVLTRLVNLYQARGHIHRVNTDSLEWLLPLYQDVTALVVFPRYEPSEIMELARQGAYLPAGITRHVVPGRALRLNFPLSVLLDDRSLDEKNAWLQDWLRAKLAGKEVRYYQESTYLFDE